TVALIDTGTANTLAAGQTDASGNFTLAPNASFQPTAGSCYYLEVTWQGSATVGTDPLQLATLVEWTTQGWASITNGTGGNGQIVVNPTTTAVVLAQNSDAANTSFSQTLGVVGPGPGYNVATAFGGAAGSAHSTDAIQALATAVASELGQNTDPLGNLYVPSARMAPDDTGNITQWHIYPKTVGGVVSDFVWVPVFTAYQLINPANCGTAYANDPVGLWVATPPSTGVLAPSGTSNGDYASETFGGFYAAQFEASHADAIPGNPTTGAGATAGSSTTLASRQYCVPWTYVNWDQAAQACQAYDGHAHLMQDDEWTALAVWAMIHDLTIFGNNAQTSGSVTYGTDSDIDNPSVTFAEDPTYTVGTGCGGGGCNVRALTGSGTDSAWASGVNYTTNTGTTNGVYDVDGNLEEWTNTLTWGDSNALGFLDLNDTSTGISLTQGSVNSLSTDPRVRRYGVPGSTSGSPAPAFGNDYFYVTATQIEKAIRGGNFDEGDYAGIWELNFSIGRTHIGPAVGFRQCLRY
ncbi:MAG: hypothetical protein KGR26_09800, partial [Cyanobacteria bacterium REEB65]|nr:hypothetical protein [Cyanobacteria bacterium REEB65]